MYKQCTYQKRGYGCYKNVKGYIGIMLYGQFYNISMQTLVCAHIILFRFVFYFTLPRRHHHRISK